MPLACLSPVILGLSVNCAAAIDGPIDLDLARQYFDDARSVSELDGGALWGHDLYGPMLFVDPASRFVVANRADAGQHLHADGDLFVGTLPDSENIANTRTRWAGLEWTMLIWPLPDDAGARRQLLAHEMFHRIQVDLPFGMGNPDNAHLDEHDGRLWMRLEWRALRAALEATGDDRNQAIEDALLFRAVRHAEYPSRVDDEIALELNEGLAEYTGIVAGRETRAARFAAATAALERYDHHPNFVRSFAYASGPAYGLLLDDVEPQWRTQLDAKSDLGRMLARACNIKVPIHPDEEAARARSAPYDGDAVLAAEDARQAQYLEQQAAFKARFEDNPILILPLSSFPSYSFDPNGIKTFGPNGRVYLTTRVVADWGILNVRSGGALFVLRGDDMVRIVVPAPSDPAASPIAGDGYTLQLDPGWVLRRVGANGNYVARRN